MKKIKDERLILKNLNNIRIAYLVQTLGIVVLLGYDIFTNGVDALIRNPLWIVLMLANTVYLWLSMEISVDSEENPKSPVKSFLISMAVLVVVAALLGFFVSISDGFNRFNGIITSAIVFFSGFLPVIYIYYLQKKRSTDEES